MTCAALRSFEAGAFTLAAGDFALLASAARIRDGFLAEHLGDLGELGPTEASVPSKDRVWLTLSVAIPGLLGGTAIHFGKPLFRFWSTPLRPRVPERPMPRMPR